MFCDHPRFRSASLFLSAQLLCCIQLPPLPSSARSADAGGSSQGDCFFPTSGGTALSHHFCFCHPWAGSRPLCLLSFRRQTFCQHTRFLPSALKNDATAPSPFPSHQALAHSRAASISSFINLQCHTLAFRSTLSDPISWSLMKMPRPLSLPPLSNSMLPTKCPRTQPARLFTPPPPPRCGCPPTVH